MTLLEVIKISLCIILTIIFVIPHHFVYCGRVKRIIGGYELECGSQPRVASLRNSSSQQHLCGATLLSARAAVTAAHCAYASPLDYVLQLNNYCVDEEEQPPRAAVLAIHRHKRYDKHSRAHDIALLSIDLHLDNIDWLEGDILPKNSFGTSGECMITGYGITKLDSEETSEKLLAAKALIVSMDDCWERLGPYMAPSPNSGMMCAVGIDSTDSCQGDSGGPILCSEDFLIEGISSYGQSCGVPDVPGVYTGIAPHLPWIRKILESIQNLTDNKQL